ncbi:hypothetical protein JZ751_001318 [Albula glossodonta]|uniref:Uncharacterized protein n=1 Tax=Albula glossodonta TaxID=121402 RepID=A0A8T2PTA8_9TELE|nr:hypothetical protein JZ751_001318 [Albula glossodonta]
MLCFKAVLRTLEAKASSCPVTKKLLFVLLPSVWRSEMRGGPVTMGSYTTSSEILDETHCCWVMCPHPCCWEAEQRVARGIARRIQSRVPGRNGVLIEEECPTLKIVNVGSEWVKTRKPSKKKLPHRAFSSESSHSFTSQSPLPRHSINLLRDSGITLESVRDLHFPELKSAAKSPYSTNNKHSREVKLSKAKISPLESSCGILCDSVSMVIWMPNPKHVPHSPTHHRWKSPHFAVKDLTCIPSSQMCKTAKLLAHTKMVSPSGSLPGHTISQIGLHTTEPSPTDTRVELTIGKNQETMQPEREPEPHVVPRPATAAGEASACLRSKPAVFCRVRERGAQRVAFQSAPTHHAHYRLDSKNCSEGIDWLRLRSQTYLWKRQKLRQHWDKDSPTLPLHRLPQHHTQPDSKATLLCHHRSALAIGAVIQLVTMTYGCDSQC